MPTPTSTQRDPKYRLHKPTGRAVVTIAGRDIYLGRHGTPESHERYANLIREWRAAATLPPHAPADLRVAELCDRFLTHARAYYRKDGKETSEVDAIRAAMGPLVHLYADLEARELRPRLLKIVRQEMISRGWVRKTVNQQIGRILRMYRWAVENEYVPVETHTRLCTIAGLRAGRTDARESEPVRAIPDATIQAVKSACTPIISDMIELQALTGMRSGELVIMRGRDLETTGRVWFYRPASHKTAHHGHARIIYIGPQAQEILRRWLKPDLQATIFSPADEESARLAEHSENSTSRRGLTIGQRRRAPGSAYTVASYRRAFQRACDRAFPHPDPRFHPREIELSENDRRMETIAEVAQRLTDADRAELNRWQKDHRWFPHQLRHTAATRLRKEFGLEAARVILGHQSTSMTELYAEIDHAKGEEIMSKVG